MTQRSTHARSRRIRHGVATFALVGLLAGLAWSSTAATAPALADEPLTEAQKQAVRDLVRETLLDDPEIIAMALEALQDRQRADETAKARAAIQEHMDALTAAEPGAVLGNPDGDVTVVEFSDYQCGYCKRVFPDLMTAVETDGNVRLVIRELPILGPDSVMAARAAVASRAQGQYPAFHKALMALRGGLSEASVLQLAAEVGLDVEQLRADMADPELDQRFQSNVTLARALGITGTPAFVIGGDLVPGAVSLDRLKELISAARTDG
ncbi:DsbA family protein [Roseospira marina]|uniref:DsbA family protein n=1 Tax=Roseospira marina TaxID=140057 RepID=A0A5M6IF01_9PROT|nr:DsbA family protein [Roseospira marina]KAA5606315.1 DsbA family protein [Roseospira marina]MBB4314477.1 protein-disulfide isomerase [Roseospira marina]MBB5087637.1 protein-disulfide isomerase [Roseospira marina]